jgi:hypothetical protein
MILFVTNYFGVEPNLYKGNKRIGNHIVKTGSLAKTGITMIVEIFAVLIL